MYDFKKTEEKWRKYWKENKIYKFDKERKDKIYQLEMFSYPSGAKLHMGHWYNYSVPDAWGRFKRMTGHNVFNPMGFDAFGLPAENYAIKTGIHPKDSTEKNIETMIKQIEAIGGIFDWDNDVITCREEYYKWTQWMFLQLYKHDIAYKKEAPVNYCPSCNTVLANEQVIGGECERCGSTVIRKNLSQWFFKITKYADELLEGLDTIDWPEKTKSLQKNWIGKSEGALVNFAIKDTEETFDVFTTRVDTLYGCTYCVLAPENPLVDIITKEEYKEKVEKYKKEVSKINEIDRTSTVKEKTGVPTGAYAINPINGKEVPIWISDYVLATYGTGAVMAVPAHDERDYEFATKFKLDIIPVIESENLPYIGDGKYINSDLLNGLTDRNEAKEKITKKLEELNKGKKTTSYKLRDWLVSRQRYWGAPIPIIYCDKCGMVPVPEEDLPVKLPYDVEFTPDGESPLAKSEEFVNCTCPKCKGKAKRECDTLDTFVCSSWYYLRYPDAFNKEKPFSKEVVDKMLPVDVYIGGVEHACMHLLYARFFTKALRDMGYLSFDEPFKKLIHQGMILDPEGRKMSKSKGNTVSPDEFIEKYGSDVLRAYLMFGFNYEDGGPWSDDGIKAIDKFIKRVYRLVENYDGNNKKETYEDIDYVLNNTIKNIRTDIENFQMNTSIARIMEYVNILTKKSNEGLIIPKHYLETLTLLLAPFTPHITEEMWEMLGHTPSVHNEKYPEVDETKLEVKTFEMVIQVNGKVRGKEIIKTDSTKEEMEEKALNNENAKKFIKEKEIVKIISIPNKLVNIVVK
ncbi:MAG: leucine--tRNA ligase [Bacilli bacterium]|nr:leucine--tRNA ligase [Bacilli bacterium]